MAKAKAKKKTKKNSTPAKKTQKTATKKKSPKKSTTKAASKKTATKKKEVASSKKVEKPSVEKAVEQQPKEVRATRSPLMELLNHKAAPYVVAGLILLGGLLFLFKDQFIVAWVNGEPITKASYVNQMEQQVGQQTLDNMILTTLIEQEAQKQGVVISDEEIQAEMATIEEQVGDSQGGLDQLLSMQGMSREDLIEQIRTQKMVEALSPADSDVSQEEIDTFLSENADFLPEDATEEELEELAKEQLSSQNQQQQVQAWLDGLKTQAEITYWK